MWHSCAAVSLLKRKLLRLFISVRITIIKALDCRRAHVTNRLHKLILESLQQGPAKGHL